MTVLHVISGGETGGSKNHVISLLAAFPKEEVLLVTLIDGAFAEEARNSGIRTISLQQASRYDFSVLKKLRTIIMEEKISIVHSHGPRANLLLYLIRFTTSFRWITTIHSDPTKDFIKGGLKGKIFTAINMSVIQKIDHFFAVSEPFQQMLVGFNISKSKISVIYNGISFQEDDIAQITRESLGVSNSDFIVAMVARYHPIKNHQMAFDAVNEVRAQGVPIQLLCIGEGTERKKLEELSNNKPWIHLLGFRSDVASILKEIDVLLLTSDSESFPLVLLEAAKAHKAVITTNVGGVSKLVVTNELGRIVPIGDKEATVKAILDLVDSKTNGQLSVMGDALYHHAKKNFSIEQLVAATRETYKNILIN